MSKTYKRNDNRSPKWDKHSNKKSRKQWKMDKEVFKHRHLPQSQGYSEDIIDELSGL